MNEATDDENDSILEGYPLYDKHDFIGPELGDYELLNEGKVVLNQVYYDCKETYDNPKFVTKVEKVYR